LGFDYGVVGKEADICLVTDMSRGRWVVNREQRMGSFVEKSIRIKEIWDETSFENMVKTIKAVLGVKEEELESEEMEKEACGNRVGEAGVGVSAVGVWCKRETKRSEVVLAWQGNGIGAKGCGLEVTRAGSEECEGPEKRMVTGEGVE
jgi:hypothetical protein